MKNINKLIISIVTFALILSVLPTTALAAKTVPVKKIALNMEAKMMRPKQTVKLTATITPSNATTKKVTWKSSKPYVAKVSVKGNVTAVKTGTTTITAKTPNGKTAKTAITVSKTAKAVTGVILRKAVTLTITAKDKIPKVTLKATVSPAKAKTKVVNWTSSNTKAATVSSKGVVTAKAAGTTTITAKTKDGGKTAKCTVTVNNNADVSTFGAYKLNTQHVTIYAIDDDVAAFGKLKIPDRYPQSFQLLINGQIRSDVRWEMFISYTLGDGVWYNDWVSAEAIINSAGLVKPLSDVSVTRPNGNTYKRFSYKTWDIRAVIGGKILPFKVTVANYAKVLSEQIVDDWMEKNISGSMASLDKVEAIARYVAEFKHSNDIPYDNRVPSNGFLMPVLGYGDCWVASTLCAEMLQRAGFRVGLAAFGTYGSYTGSNHQIAVVEVDGKFYEVESSTFATEIPHSLDWFVNMYWYDQHGGFSIYD